MNENNKHIENFSQAKIRNTCHYTCSSINYLNIFIFVIMIIVIYHFILTNFIQKNN